MTLSISPQAVDTTAIEARLTAAEEAAADADAKAMNARQMILNRDPRLNTVEGRTEALADAQVQLEALAQTLGAAIPASEATHAAINKRIDDEATARQQADASEAQARAAGDAALGSRITTAETAIGALQAAVAALQALKVTVGFGAANLPASLGAGATTNVTVTLSRDMGSTAYSVGYGLSGGTTLLGQLRVASVVGQTRTTVTLAVKNEGLAALLNLSTGTLSVVAARDA